MRSSTATIAFAVLGTATSAALKREYPERRRERRQTATESILRRVQFRALIAHITRTRRWCVTNLGQRLLQTAIQRYDHGISNYSLTAQFTA